MRWDEAKQHARKKFFYRKLLHQYGIPYIETIGIKVSELINILKQMK